VTMLKSDLLCKSRRMEDKQYLELDAPTIQPTNISWFLCNLDSYVFVSSSRCYIYHLLAVWSCHFPVDFGNAPSPFQIDKSVLNLNSNSSDVKGKDAMHNTHPILNILKKTLDAFLIPGSELSLDEA
jgi:hypothetical protein